MGCKEGCLYICWVGKLVSISVFDFFSLFFFLFFLRVCVFRAGDFCQVYIENSFEFKGRLTWHVWFSKIAECLEGGDGRR